MAYSYLFLEGFDDDTFMDSFTHLSGNGTDQDWALGDPMIPVANGHSFQRNTVSGNRIVLRHTRTFGKGDEVVVGVRYNGLSTAAGSSVSTYTTLMGVSTSTSNWERGNHPFYLRVTSTGFNIYSYGGGVVGSVVLDGGAYVEVGTELPVNVSDTVPLRVWVDGALILDTYVTCNITPPDEFYVNLCVNSSGAIDDLYIHDDITQPFGPIIVESQFASWEGIDSEWSGTWEDTTDWDTDTYLTGVVPEAKHSVYIPPTTYQPYQVFGIAAKFQHRNESVVTPYIADANGSRTAGLIYPSVAWERSIRWWDRNPDGSAFDSSSANHVEVGVELG